MFGYVILLQLAFACSRLFVSCNKQDQNICNERASYELPVITPITEPVNLGEGPHWDSIQQVLYFVDINGHSIHRYNPQNNQHTSLTLSNFISVIIPVHDKANTFVIGLGTKLTTVTWDGQHPEHDLKILTAVETDRPDNRFNDAKADKNGRLWIGTMGKRSPNGDVEPNQGSLYRWNYEKCNLENIVTPVSISNGIAWSYDFTKMYYIDSPLRQIDVFQYEISDGSIGNRQTVFKLDTHSIPGIPDGMTIDSCDNLWIAIMGGSRVIKVNPNTGKLLRTIMMPAERITSCTFGGKYLDTLFVTSIREGLNTTELQQQPHAGAVFSVTNLGVTGTLNNPAVIPNCSC